MIDLHTKQKVSRYEDLTSVEVRCVRSKMRYKLFFDERTNRIQKLYEMNDFVNIFMRNARKISR